MSFVKTWSDGLADTDTNLELATKQAKRELREKVRIKRHEARFTPMTKRIELLHKAMPLPEQSKPRHIQEFVRLLAPRYSGKTAQAGQVGTALRELGWQRKRKWLSEERTFETLWWPPVDTD